MGYFGAYEKGRQAFADGLKETDYPSEYSKSQRQAWKSGYREAQREEEQDAEALEWVDTSSKCPWYVDGACMARRETEDPACSKTNCAPYYFGAAVTLF